MNKTSFLILSLAVLISACSKENISHNEQGKGMLYDSELKMYVSENFYEHDYKFVGNISNIPGLLDNETLAGQLQEPESTGVIVFRQQISLIAKGHERGIDEVSKTVPGGYV